MKSRIFLTIVLAAAALLMIDPPDAAGQDGDAQVPAELGGPGFERIAASQGWETGTISEDEFRYIADPNARKGGTISLGIGEFPLTLRSMGRNENAVMTRFVYGFVYESLIDINPLTLEFLPYLATHWKVGPDKQTYYFRIDPNARFSDGHPVTTADVIATDKLGRDTGILSPYTNSFHNGFDPPVAISRYIFSVRSRTMNWKNMFYFGATVKILPAHLIEGLSGSEYLKKYRYAMLPGSGPYVVKHEDVVPAKSITLTRRADWWQGEYPVNRKMYNFDRIAIHVVMDPNLLRDKFRTGELDVYLVGQAGEWRERLDFEEVRRGLIQKRKIYTDDPVGFGGLALNARNPPFDDPKVRLAMMHLFDRDGILEEILHNEYVPTYSYYPNSPYENPNNPRYDYDPELAAQLLAEAGWTQRNSEGVLVKDDVPFVVNMPTSMAGTPLLERVMDDLGSAGIKVEVEPVGDAALSKILNTRTFDLTYTGWGGILYPNPISSFSSDLADRNNTNNITGFRNTRADEIIDLEQKTFSQKERIRLLRELDSILVTSNHYALNFHAPFNRIAYWNKFGQPEWYLGKLSDWQSIFVTWWIDPAKARRVEQGKRDGNVRMEVGKTNVTFWPEYNRRKAVERKGK